MAGLLDDLLHPLDAADAYAQGLVSRAGAAAGAAANPSAGVASAGKSVAIAIGIVGTLAVLAWLLTKSRRGQRLLGGAHG